MATTTTKSKAKTKTTKKPSTKAASAKITTAKAVKAAPKTRAAKTTTKAKATKKAPVATTKPAAKTTKTTGSNGQFVFTAVAFTLLAGLAGYFMKADSVHGFLGHLTRDQLASTTSTVLVSAARPVFEVEYRWLLVALLGVSAVIAVLRATKWQAKEIAAVKANSQPIRWFEAGVSGALMFGIVALLNGLQDVVALSFGIISVAASAYFAWAYEREFAAAGKAARTTLLAVRVTTLLPIITLLVTLLGTYFFGIVRSPWYAYAALAVFVLGAMATPRSIKKLATMGKHDYPTFDKVLNVQSVVMKVIFATVLIIGLYAKK